MNAINPQSRWMETQYQDLVSHAIKRSAFVSAWQDGVSIEVMSRRFGYSPSGVSRLAHRLGLEPRQRGGVRGSYNHQPKVLTRCLMHGGMFYSHDPKRERICPACKQTDAWRGQTFG